MVVNQEVRFPMDNEHQHKNHTITLLTRKLDEAWSCSYTAWRSGKSETAAGFSGRETGVTEEEAKSHALAKAKKRIDAIVG